jgi:hypothetical protein
MTNHLPEHITYACIFWIDHVCMVSEDMAALAKRIETFLHYHLLHWLEAMSMLQRSKNAAYLLERLLH